MNDQKPSKAKVSISLDKDVILKIRELAKADDRHLSQYINLVLRKHIDSFREDPPPPFAEMDQKD